MSLEAARRERAGGGECDATPHGAPRPPVDRAKDASSFRFSTTASFCTQHTASSPRRMHACARVLPEHLVRETAECPGSPERAGACAGQSAAGRTSCGVGALGCGLLRHGRVMHGRDAEFV
jgi:hypothetical protein